MTEEEVQWVVHRLVELYQDTDLQDIQALAPLVVEFGFEARLDSEAHMGTLNEWAAVLYALGREGMTLEGMLAYESPGLPGVELCRRVTDMAVCWGHDGTPYLDPKRSDEHEPLVGFVEVQPDVWLRTRGRYAIAEGVPLLVD